MEYSQKDFLPMVHLVQTMHFSDAIIKTISRQTEARFHLTHVT
jgi:hypothetical protein